MLIFYHNYRKICATFVESSKLRLFFFNHVVCHAFSVSYDYVLQLENISDELPFVLSEILDRNDVLPPQKPSDKQPRQKLMNYLRKVPANLSLAVFQLYRDDFEVLGYKMPTSQQELMDFINAS